MNTKIINLDINKKLYEIINAKQGDTESRFLFFNLFDNSTQFDLTNKSVRAYAKKPDNTEIYNDLTVNDASKGYCTLELTNQMLAVSGTVEMELVIIEGTKKLSSIPFILNVTSSVNSENAIVSTNEFTSLMNGLASLNEYDNYKNEIATARGGQVDLNTRFNGIDTSLAEKAKQVDLNDIQTQVNNLVLGAVGDGNNPEIIQARSGHNVLNERMNVLDYLAFKNSKTIENEILLINNNYYINASGDLIVNNDYTTSDAIHVDDGDVIIYTGYTDGVAVSVGGWKNSSFVKKISSNTVGMVSSTAYIIDGTVDTIFCCFKKSYGYSIKIIKAKDYKTTIHVGKGSEYKYNEIQQAINSITDDTSTNRYTIVVHEGTYSNFYTWVYGTKPRGTKRYISIIGVDKYRCIIDSAFNSTFESDGILINLWFINNNLTVNYTGLEINKDYDSQGRYALHIDYNCGGNKTLIKDCIFTSTLGCGVGIGTWSYDDFVFENCEFNCYTNNPTKAGVFFHNCGVTGTLYQNISFKNCKIYSDSITAIRIQNAVTSGANSEIKCDFINNVAYSSINGFDSIGMLSFTGFGTNGITLTNTSFGNSSTVLNNAIGNGNYITLT